MNRHLDRRCAEPQSVRGHDPPPVIVIPVMKKPRIAPGLLVRLVIGCRLSRQGGVATVRGGNCRPGFAYGAANPSYAIAPSPPRKLSSLTMAATVPSVPVIVTAYCVSSVSPGTVRGSIRTALP